MRAPGDTDSARTSSDRTWTVVVTSVPSQAAAISAVRTRTLRGGGSQAGGAAVRCGPDRIAVQPGHASGDHQSVAEPRGPFGQQGTVPEYGAEPSGVYPRGDQRGGEQADERVLRVGAGGEPAAPTVMPWSPRSSSSRRRRVLPAS